MRFISILLVLAFFMTFSKVSSQGLDQYRWKNRMLLLKDSNLASDWLQAQLKRLNSTTKELAEREVNVFLLTNEHVYNSDGLLLSMQVDSLSATYELADFKGLILIGKDGGIKLKKAFIVNPQAIIELIDSMPMRMTEMRNKP